MLKGFIAGILFVVVLVAVVAYVVVQNGWIDPRADAGYLPLEKWASRAVLRADRRLGAPVKAPIADSVENLVAGAKLYGQNCAVCHGASDAKQSTIAQGLYIQAPQLAKDGVEDDAIGETYYKIDHGMRLTPMPAFSKTLTQEQIWQLALFLKDMKTLPPQAEAEFKKIPSQASP